MNKVFFYFKNHGHNEEFLKLGKKS